MRQKFKVVSVWMLAIMLTAVFTFPVDVLAADKKADTKGNPSPTAKNVSYVTKDGKKTGISSLEIDDKTYFNLSQDEKVNPKGVSTITLNKDVLRTIAREQLFPAWSIIAEGVFNEQADQFVTIGGSGMMSSDGKSDNSFRKQFSYGGSRFADSIDDTYAPYCWSLKDLADVLASKSPITQGKRCNDYAHSTGIADVSSLDAARTMMGQELRNHADDNDISTDEFLFNGYAKGQAKRRLPGLEDSDSGDGFVNIVTCVDRVSDSGNYKYASFGLMIYDFTLTPMAAKDLQYIEAAQEFVDAENPLKAAAEAQTPGVEFNEGSETAVKSYLQNASQGEATQTVSLENSTTQEVSNTVEQTHEYSREYTVGTEIAFGDCAGVAPRSTWNFGFTYNTMWGEGKSDTTTKSTSNTKSVSAELTMPQHTVAKIVQNTQDMTFREDYQTPVILSYKVAIFGMSGDFYNGWWGAIDSGLYDKSYMSLILQNSEDSALCGHQALGALYTRMNALYSNSGAIGIDGASGGYSSWCDKGCWVKRNTIDWESVSQNWAFDIRPSHSIYYPGTFDRMSLYDFSKRIPFIEKASQVSGKRQIMTSSVSSFEPLYDLKKVRIKAYEGVFFDTRNYQLNPGMSLPLDSVVLEGLNADNYDYFGFDQEQMGDWVPCTEDGKEREQTGDEDAVVTEKEPGKGQRIITKTEVSAPPKTYYFKWVLKDDIEVTSNESPKGIDHDTVEVPILSVTVFSNSSIDEANGQVLLSGSYSGLWSEPVDLAKELNVTVESDKFNHIVSTSNIPVYWESMGKGIKVDEETGEATFESPGTYKVRAYCFGNKGSKIYSEYVDVKALEEAKLDHFTLKAPDLTETQRTLTQKKPELEFDASQWISFFDQNGNTWVERPDQEDVQMILSNPDVEWSVDDDDIAYVDNKGLLKITGPGTVTLTASVENLGEKSVTLKFHRDKWLAEVMLEEPDLQDDQLVLTDTVKSVRVENLKNLVKFYDCNEDEWTGSVPKVTFQIANGLDGGAFKNGNFVATKGGMYLLQAVTSTGIESNVIPVEVVDKSSLVLSTADPEEQLLTDSDHPLEVVLPKQVLSNTARGSEWYGDLPELEYTLAEGTENAEIKTKEVENAETIVFTCTKAGTYKVKVTPKDPAEYSAPIGDITIKVTGTQIKWQPWQKDSDTTHVRYAEDENGKTDYYVAQSEPHTWKGVLTGKSEDPEKPDVVKFTCTKCGAEKEETVAHDWSEPTYTPDKTYEHVTAERHCQHEGCISETETAEIDANAYEKKIWHIVFSAKFENPVFHWEQNDEFGGSQGEKLPGVLKAKGKTVVVKASKLKKGTVKIPASKAIKITSASGKITYKKGFLSPKNAKFKFKVKKNGTIVVKKGLKKGTYKLKVKINASGSKVFEKKTKTVTVKFKVR